MQDLAAEQSPNLAGDSSIDPSTEQCSDRATTAEDQSHHLFQRVALSLEDACVALRWLAAFHAFFWESPPLSTTQAVSNSDDGAVTRLPSSVTRSATAVTVPSDLQHQGHQEPGVHVQVHDLVGTHLWAEGMTPVFMMPKNIPKNSEFLCI